MTERSKPNDSEEAPPAAEQRTSFNTTRSSEAGSSGATLRSVQSTGSRKRGFTLLELMVATGVLVMLGGALVVVLRGGIKTWRRSEARRESFETAQAVIGQLADDLAAATVDPVTAHARVEAIFLGEPDEAGRPRLALVRTIRGESENPITGHAGSATGGDARIDYHDDMKKAFEGRLRATGGLMEVAWCLGRPGTPESEVLYRGIRTPIGGAASFFSDRKNDDGSLRSFFLAPLPGAPPSKVQVPEDVAYCRAFGLRVAYFELLYATPYTNTWEPLPPRRKTSEKSGPLAYWDSTRGILAVNEDPAKNFTTFKSEASRNDSTDDVLPTRVKVTLVVHEPDAADSSTTLFRDIGKSGDTIVVTEPGRLPREGGFICVDGEWMSYDSVSGSTVHVERGRRSTKASSHVSGAEVILGRTFEVVLPVAAGREDWGDR